MSVRRNGPHRRPAGRAPGPSRYPAIRAHPTRGRTRPRSVDLCADDGISDARRVADPHGVNLARWCTLCGRVLYARNGTYLEPGIGCPRCSRRRVRAPSWTCYLERVHDVVDQPAGEAIVVALDAAGVASRSVAPLWATRAPLRRPRPPAVAARWPVMVSCQPSLRALAATSSSRQPRPGRLAIAQARGARSAPGQAAEGAVATSWTCPQRRPAGHQPHPHAGSR